MPFQFTCPYCFKKTFVEDKYAGRTGPCASCGKVVTLPILGANQPKNLSSKTLFVAGQSDSTGLLDSTSAEESQAVTTQDPPALFPAAVSTNTFANSATTSPRDRTAQPPAVVFASQPVDNAPTKRRRYTIAGAVTATVVVLGLVTWFSIDALRSSSLIQTVQDRRNRTQCMNQLSRIARALDTYAATYGTYPPPIVYDEKGQPKHSWRVLILREMGEHALYNRYDFDKSWDSEANAKLFTECPSCYISPAVGANSITSEANYFLLIGPSTAFPGTSNLTPNDITDGKDRTLLVVEAANPIHEWSKPIDVSASGKGLIKMGGCHQGGVAAAKADGQAAWIPDDAPPELINDFMTINGNEDRDPDTFKP